MSNPKYTEDDLHCFENIQWEMGELTDFLIDCNHRKITFFKFSLGVMSVFITIFGILFKAISEGYTLSSNKEIQIIIAIILLVMCFINYIIIKELFSIHSSRVLVIRQMNCLRQVMDSIRFKKHEGSYPSNVSELNNETSKYWNIFGKHRKLQLENSSLKDSEKSWSKSPDMFMILILLIVSIFLQLSASLYLVTSQEIGNILSFLTGGIVVLTSIFMVMDVRNSRDSLKKSLGIQDID